MNTVILMGRLTRDPEIRYGATNNTAVARYSLAVDRRFKQDGQLEIDFFNIVSFGKAGEFVEKYLHKGTKIVIDGELHNNNYKNKDGQMVYGIEIVTRNIEFAESKNSQGTQDNPQPMPSNVAAEGGWMNIPDGIDEELPFN